MCLRFLWIFLVILHGGYILIFLLRGSENSRDSRQHNDSGHTLEFPFSPNPGLYHWHTASTLVLQCRTPAALAAACLTPNWLLQGQAGPSLLSNRLLIVESDFNQTGEKVQNQKILHLSFRSAWSGLSPLSQSCFPLWNSFQALCFNISWTCPLGCSFHVTLLHTGVPQSKWSLLLTLLLSTLCFICKYLFILIWRFSQLLYSTQDCIHQHRNGLYLVAPPFPWQLV